MWQLRAAVFQQRPKPSVPMADPGVCVCDRGDHPPPLNLCWSWKPMQSVRDRDRSPPPHLGMLMMSHRHRPRGVLVNVQAVGVCLEGGGGVLVNVLKGEGDEVTRAMSKGGCTCECLHPPFRKSCIRACHIPPCTAASPYPNSPQQPANPPPPRQLKS